MSRANSSLPASTPIGRQEKIRYSDTNFQLLNAILETQMEKPLYKVFDELIFRPTGMQHTYFEENFPDDYPTPASFWVGKEIFRQPLLLRSFRDLYSTADDQLKFMRALMTGTLFDRPETEKLMQQHWNRFGFPISPATVHQPSWPIEYGYGMMRFDLPRFFAPFKPIPAFVGHTGVLGSWLFYCPKLDLYLCGTVGQITAAPLPFRFVPRLLHLFESTR